MKKTTQSIICQCKTVTRHDIAQLIRKNPDALFQEIRAVTGASTGCGRCAPQVKEVIAECKTRQKPNPQFRILFE